jgi:hypothetical protein
VATPLIAERPPRIRRYTLLAQMYRVRERELSQDQAYKVIWDGVKAYCPEKAGALRLP